MSDMEAVKARYPDAVCRGHGKECWIAEMKWSQARERGVSFKQLSKTFHSEFSYPITDEQWAIVEARAWASARELVEAEINQLAEGR